MPLNETHTEHTLVEVPAVAATTEAAGNLQYWKCSDPDCGDLFLDADGNTPTTLEEVTVAQFEPETPAVDTNPATDDILYLTEKQFQNIIILLMEKANERTLIHFADEVKKGDVKHAPTGDAVWNAIEEAIEEGAELGTEEANKYTDEEIAKVMADLISINNWKYERIIGSFPTEPEPKTIYLQIDDEDDKTYVMWIYSNEKWVCIGDTSIDLVNYWEKDNIKGLADALVNDPYFMSMLFTGKEPEESTTPNTKDPVIINATPGATVTATHEDGDEVIAIADENGKATLYLPKEGNWTIDITNDATPSQGNINVTDPTELTGNNITLSQKYVVKTTPGAKVTATHEDGDEIVETADINGEAIFTFTKSGNWNIVITNDEKPVPPSIDVTGTTEIPVTFIRKIKATPGSEVKAVHTPDGDEVTATADENGIAELELHNHEGRWNITITPPDDYSVDVSVGDASTKEPLVVKATPGSTVTATHDPDGDVVSSIADDNGEAKLDLPKEGKWDIDITPPAGSDDIEITVEDKEDVLDTNLDNRFFRKANVEEVIEAVDAEDVFFNRTKKEHYEDTLNLLNTGDDATAAQTNTGLTADDTLSLRTTATSALDSLSYIRNQVLANLLGVTEGDGLTKLTPEIVNEAILKIVNESGEIANLTEDDLDALKEELGINELLDDLPETYVAIADLKKALGIADEDDITAETTKDAIMKIVDDNKEKLTSVTDEHLEEILNVAFAKTIPQLEEIAPPATDAEVQAMIDETVVEE